MKNPELFAKIKKLSSEIENDLISFRRQLHMYPEIGRAEHKTAAKIKAEINTTNGFKFHNAGETGFAVDLVADKSKNFVAIRADMDALPIQDKKNVEYRSRNDGICHACGHDFHSASLLGVFKVLSQLKPYLSGNIRFIFQHAEEPIPGGALDFVEAGLLKNIDAIFGFHADPDLKVNQLGIRPGWNSAQSIYLKIKLKGKGGHSARPNLTNDLNYIGANLINDLYGAVSRKNDPEFPSVLSFGKIQSGVSYNTIPETFETEGTLRVTKENIGDNLLNYFEKSVKYMGYKWKGIQTEFIFQKGAPPVWNDMNLTRLITSIYSEIVKEKNIVNIFPSMGGEDFSHYLKKVPGVFTNIGIKGTRRVHSLHSPFFDIDERSIGFLVSLFSYTIIRFMQKYKV